jgi:hypothetical protein
MQPPTEAPSSRLTKKNPWGSPYWTCHTFYTCFIPSLHLHPSSLLMPALEVMLPVNVSTKDNHLPQISDWIKCLRSPLWNLMLLPIPVVFLLPRNATYKVSKRTFSFRHATGQFVCVCVCTPLSKKRHIMVMNSLMSDHYIQLYN